MKPLRRKRAAHVVLILAGLACLFMPLGVAPDGERSRGLLGPFRGIFASFEWVAFTKEETRGAWDEAYLHARRALRWDPEAHEGWANLAAHFIFLRASKENEPDPVVRARWIQRGLDLLHEGERQSTRPAQLAQLSGQYQAFWICELAGEGEESLPWPGGPKAAWGAGVDALRRAEALGHHEAELALEIAFRMAQEKGWLEKP